MLGGRVVERLAPVRGQRLHQRGQVRGPARPAAAEGGQGRGIGQDEPPQQGLRKEVFVVPGPACGRGQPAYEPLGVHRDQVPGPVLQGPGQPHRTVLLQQREHALRRGGQGRGHARSPAVPPAFAQALRQFREFARRLVQHRAGMTAAQPRPPGDGVRQLRQQPGSELRSAGREEGGGLAVAPLGPQDGSQTFRELPALTPQHGEGQVPADFGGGVVVRRLDRPVRHGQGVYGPQGVGAHQRVRVGQPLRQVLRLLCRERRECGQPLLVAAESGQPVQYAGQFAGAGEIAGGGREQPQPVGVRERIEVGEQAFGRVRHADSVPTGADGAETGFPATRLRARARAADPRPPGLLEAPAGYTGMGTDTNRLPESFSTRTSFTLAGSTAADPSSEAPLPSPFWLPTTQLPAGVRLPSRPTTTSMQRSPGGIPATAACTRTHLAAGVT